MLPALFVSVVLAGSSPAAPPPLANLLKEAQAQQQPVLLDIYTAWCAPCARLAKEVFPRPDVQRALAGYRFVSYDAEKGAGIDVAENFKVNEYPTLLVLSPTGELVSRFHPDTAEQLIATLDQLRPVAKASASLEERAKSSRDPQVLWLAALQQHDPALARALYLRAKAADEGNARGIASKVALVEAREATELQNAKAHGQQLLRLARAYPGSDEAVKALGGIGALAKSAWPSAKDLRPTVTLVTRALEQRKDAGALNTLVYDAIDLGQPAAAIGAAQALVRLTPDVADNIDTLAEAYFQSGDRERAVSTEKKALALHSSQGLLANLKRFAETSPTHEPLLPHADPLAPPHAEEPWDVAQRELHFFETHLTDRVHSACPALPALEYMRLYLDAGKVTRAVLLDPELSPDQRACAEHAALEADHFPHHWTGKQTVTAKVQVIPPHAMM